MMPPAFDTGYVCQGQSVCGGVFPGGLLTGQHHAGGPVGDLAAVHFTHRAIDYRVQFVVIGKAARGEIPVAGLGVGVVPGIAEVDAGNGIEVVAVDAVALVVLPGDPVKQVWPGEVTGIGLVAQPARGTQVLSAGLAVHIAHHLQPHHAGNVVMSRLDIAHGGKYGDGAGGAGRLMARGGYAGQLRINLAEKAAQQPLAGEQVADEISHMSHLNLRGFDSRRRDTFPQHLGKHVVDLQILAGPVAGEIGLAATEYINVLAHGFPPVMRRRPAGPVA